MKTLFTLVLSLLLVSLSAQAETKVIEGTSKLIISSDGLPQVAPPTESQNMGEQQDGDRVKKPVAVRIGETRAIGAELVILGASADALWDGFSRGNPSLKIERHNGIEVKEEKLAAVFLQINLAGITCTRPESEALGNFIQAQAKSQVLKDFAKTRCVVRVATTGVVTTGLTAIAD